MKSLAWILLVCTVTCYTAPTSVVADDQVDLSLQPYIAYVASDGQHTRCGPSEKYYKTDPLKAGQAVEVYLETEDDWLGIRPPENSFCWLQSDQVEVAEDEVTGTVIDSSAYSWIGTHLGRAQKYSWQVRLDVGEEVTIIGTARRDGPDGEEFWYRIVPPPGEFRWLHRSQIVMSPDEVDHAKPTPLPNRRLANTSQRRPKENDAENVEATSQIANIERDVNLDAPVKEQPNNVVDDQPIGSGLAVTSPPAPPASSEQMDAKPTDTEQSRWLSQQAAAIATSPNENVAPAGFSTNSTRTSAGAGHLDPQAVGGQAGPVLRSVIPQGQAYRPQSDLATATVETLQLELSRAMAAEATAIQLQPLRERCAQLATNAQDAVNRGRAALLLQRVDDYRRVVTQRSNPSAIQQASATGDVQMSDTTAIAAATGVETKFDRQGWLVKVYSARPNAPPFAITDSFGRTLSYVTPVPGINLRRYLNQEIGLYGRVAFDTSLETPHLIAEQAVRIRR